MNTRASKDMILSHRTWLWWFVFLHCIIITIAASRELSPQNDQGGSYSELDHHHRTPLKFSSQHSQNFEFTYQKLRNHHNARSLMTFRPDSPSPSPSMIPASPSPSPSHNEGDFNEEFAPAPASQVHEEIASSHALSPSIKALHEIASPPASSFEEITVTSPSPAQSLRDLHGTQTISATPTNSSSNSSSSPSPYIPLDKNQLLSLQSLGMQFNTEQDPCSDQSILCDKSYPYRHILSLHLQFCPRDAKLSTEDLSKLQTLNTLTFKDCPMQLPSPVPSNLLNSLSTLTCTDSLGYSPQYTSLPPLPSFWLSSFRKLEEISIADVRVNNTDGLSSIISQMPHLKTLRFSKTNVSGILPVNMWPANLTHIDLYSNYINGSLPEAIAKLELLQDLNLAKNNLEGDIPPSLGNMQRLERLVLSNNGFSGPIPESLAEAPSLMYLDLSHNNLTGSVPEAFNKMENVRYLDLSHNHLKGRLPFNQSFLDKLNNLKVRGNIGICYDHKAVKSSFLEGVPDCDSTGMPVVPSTESEEKPNSKSDDAGAADNEEGTASAVSGGPMAQVVADDSSAVTVIHHRRHGSVMVGVAIALVAVFVVIVVSVHISRCRNRK